MKYIHYKILCKLGIAITGPKTKILGVLHKNILTFRNSGSAWIPRFAANCFLDYYRSHVEEMWIANASANQANIAWSHGALLNPLIVIVISVCVFSKCSAVCTKLFSGESHSFLVHAKVLCDVMWVVFFQRILKLYTQKLK